MVQRVAALLIMALVARLAAQPTDRNRAEALARQAANRLQVLTEEAERLASQARSLLGDLRKLELDRRIRTEELHKVEAEAAALEGDLAALDEEVGQLDEQRRLEQPLIEARLVDLYKLGDSRYLRLLLSTSDLRGAAQASRVLAVLAKRDRERMAAQQQRVAELQTSRKTIDERAGQLEVLRQRAQAAQAAATEAVRKHNTLLAQVDRRRDLNAQLTGELQLAQAQLQGTLKALASGGTAAPAFLPLGPFRGELDWPVVGTLRSHWQSRPHAGQGSADAARLVSNGIEIAAQEGTPVQAIHPGTVAYADTFAGFGRLVIVDHGAQNFSVYGHLLDIQVQRGAQVDRGQTLGSVGTPPAGAPGLYFELRIDGQPVDPLQWLRRL